MSVYKQKLRFLKRLRVIDLPIKKRLWDIDKPWIGEERGMVSLAIEETEQLYIALEEHYEKGLVYYPFLNRYIRELKWHFNKKKKMQRSF